MDTLVERSRSVDTGRWEAVMRRDPRAGGAFVYAVRTTGIYCRPTCPSRRPRRENVLFFDQAETAERGGFRACRRCGPKVQASDGQHREAIAGACRLLDEAETTPDLKTLAAATGLSRFHFHRLFKRVVGVTPREYGATRRLLRLQDGLAQGGSVTRAIYDAGFGSSSRVYERAPQMLGMAPSRYRTGGNGVEIRSAVVRSSLGWVLVAATARGICAIEFGDSPSSLGARLRARFPRARLRPDDPRLSGWVERVTAFIEEPASGLSLPLDIRGTAFQRRVWKALQAIGPGQRATYAEVARRIGQPRAIRAVAGACASNRLAVVVPCHRVVRSDGGLGGYRWGLRRKRTLLAREAKRARAGTG